MVMKTFRILTGRQREGDQGPSPVHSGATADNPIDGISHCRYNKAVDVPWTVKVQRNVEQRQLPRLPEGVRLLAAQAVVDLRREGPWPHGWDVKRLEGVRYRLRLKRAYRMIYQVYKGVITIEVVFAGHRKDAQKYY
jgi:mRNA-degrading endonuclease RelE of RelBE toxin-antitoxin system